MCVEPTRARPPRALSSAAHTPCCCTYLWCTACSAYPCSYLSPRIDSHVAPLALQPQSMDAPRPLHSMRWMHLSTGRAAAPRPIPSVQVGHRGDRRRMRTRAACMRTPPPQIPNPSLLVVAYPCPSPPRPPPTAPLAHPLPIPRHKVGRGSRASRARRPPAGQAVAPPQKEPRHGSASPSLGAASPIASRANWSPQAMRMRSVVAGE